MNYFLQTLLASDYASLLILIPPALLSIFAQFLVKSTFEKYSKVANARGITGKEAAAFLMQSNGLSQIKIEPIRGSLTDHYDPRTKTLRLSETVYAQKSIAAVGVAAHETGHALQDKFHYAPLVLRSTLVPMANIGSSAGPWLVIAGLVSSYPILTPIGIALFSLSVAFYLVTLPVEFNASHRALQNLASKNILSRAELSVAKKVLTAAALTYVASALSSVTNLIRLVLISRNRRNHQ